MLIQDPDLLPALKFWLFFCLGLVLCVWAGRLAAGAASPLLLAVFAGVGAAAVTFYSPRLALSLIVFSMLLSPKIPGMHLAEAERHGTVLVRFDDLLLVIVFLAWIARSSMVKKGSAFLASTPLNLPIFLYTAVCVLSTALGVLRGDYQPLRPLFYLLKYVEYFLLFFMTVNVAEGRALADRYMRFGWITAMIVSLYGYSQIPSGERVTAPFEAALGASPQERLQASEPNTLGGYYLVVFGMLLAGITQGGGAEAARLTLSFLFMLPPFLMTLSRSSYLGLAGAAFFHMTATRRRRVQLALGFGGAALLVLLVPTLRRNVLERVEYTFTGVEKGVRGQTYSVGAMHLEGSAYARFTSWRRIFFEEFPKHPLLGAGVTGVGLSDAQYPLVIGETGLVGFFLFLWMIKRVWDCAWFLWRSAELSEDKALGLGLLTALVGLLLHATAANTFIIVRVMEPFWFLAALAARRYAELTEREPRA